MGHYDECRDGYCGKCGQTEGNCEHTQKGFKQHLEWDYTPRVTKKEDLHHFLPDLAEKYGIKPIAAVIDDEVFDMTKLHISGEATVAHSTISYEELKRAFDKINDIPRINSLFYDPESQYIVLDCVTKESAKKVLEIFKKGLS